MTVQIFTSSANWTCPAGVITLQVECWGGGAGGQILLLNTAGSGGGGGAYSKIEVAVHPGEVAACDVGAQVGSNTNGNPSVFSGDWWYEAEKRWVPLQTLCVAKGGKKDGSPLGAGLGGQASEGTGDVKYSGGNGGKASHTAGAGGGEGAGTDSDGHGGTHCTSYSTGSAGGTGGDGGDGGTGGNFEPSELPGSPGNTTGGGGGGGCWSAPTPPAGGAGAAGKIVLTWTEPINVVQNVITVRS